jgi:dipeptidyl aminopeptidase/acylaminoacyl peptidase
VVEVWNLSAGERLYQSVPQGFGVDREEAEEVDPRTIRWAPTLPATAGYLVREERSDGTVEHVWRSVQVGGQARDLARSERPIREFGWTSAGTPLYMVDSSDGERSDIRVVLPGSTKTLWSGNRLDRYEDPGRPVRVDGLDGPILEAGGSIFLAGSGLTPDGVQPFLERLDLATGESRRVFTADANVLEIVLAVLDPAAEIILTRRETATAPPVYRRVQSGRATELYRAPNPYPQLDRVKRQRISYPRADGVTLSGTLYLPENAGAAPLPTLIWIYPREYGDRDLAQQADTRPFEFHSIRGSSPLAAVLAGYAVLLNPTVPIISHGDPDNQEYLPQLVSSVNAAVDYLVEEGISDPARMAIGGRSYGAFSTANLLIHSDRFAAGITMSGACNRTLTPFGFQHEKRSFWDATEYYTSISPFFFANRIRKPLLLVHGGADSNPGTPKAQARRLYHALVGEGATVRYVELPGEEHHYSGRETVLHAAWEMIDWLDRMPPAVDATLEVRGTD